MKTRMTPIKVLAHFVQRFKQIYPKSETSIIMKDKNILNKENPMVTRNFTVEI